MVMKKLLRFLLGSTKFEVKCNDAMRTSAKLMQKFSYAIIDTKILSDNSFEFICIFMYKKYVTKYLKKNDLQFQKLKNYGILELLEKMLKRPGLALGIVMSVAICYFQSVLIWEIVVTGNHSVSDSEIIEGLSDVGFRIGGIKTNELLYDYSNKFIINDPRISRMSINISGNVAFVEVGERAIAPENETVLSMTGLFSNRNGMVELPIAESGKSLVKPGESVYEGQMLISPIIYGDNDIEYIVGAKGKVYARTRDCFTVNISLMQENTELSDKKLSKITFSFLGKDFTLPILRQKDDGAYFKYDKEKLILFNKFEFPLYITREYQYKHSTNEIILTHDETKKLAYEKMYSFISQVKGDAEIVNTDFNENIDENGFTLKCIMESIENIATVDF